MMKRTLGLQWHITDECDQRCEHCYIYNGGKKEGKKLELDLNELIEILDNYLELCSKMNVGPAIALTGGDPLLHKQVWQLLEILKKRNVPFAILGNPFHLNFDVVKKLEDCGCFGYQMSLDGLEETHDKIRKPGSFQSTIDAFRYFENSKIQTVVMATVSKTNMNEIPELVDIVVKNGIDKFAFARYCPNEGDNDLMLSSEEYRQFLEKMFQKYMEYAESNTILGFKDHLWIPYLYEKGLFNPEEYDDNQILDGCNCGLNHITVLADGTVYACRRCESPVGKVSEKSLYDIFNGLEMDQYRKYEKFECKNCKLFRFCRGCPAVAKCATGNFYKKDPQCWFEA